MFQLDLLFSGQRLQRKESPAPKLPQARQDHSWIWKHGLTVHLLHRPRARRYLLRFQTNGTLRLVIPRRGNPEEGKRFLDRCEPWILKRLTQWQKDQPARGPWTEGRPFLFRGQPVTLSIQNQPDRCFLTFADQIIPLPGPLPDYRQVLLAHLRQLAQKELPDRTAALAKRHAVTVHRVTVRDQKTRWGSCSIRGTISLNWRLIQTPPQVVDYIIIHELMHRREMNHSARYWKLVADAFADYQDAELWLKKTRLESLS
jgi:predicted metal-dependent hydrolase